MKHLDRPLARCPFANCPTNTAGARARIIRHSRLKTRSALRRRFQCKVCCRTFIETLGTPYYRLRRSKKDFDSAARLQGEGVTKAGVARFLQVSPSTVARWLERAAKHARAFHESHAKLDYPVEFQLDELRCNGVGEARNAWAYSGIEVWSRFWVALQVGNRTLRSTFLFVRQLRSVLAPRILPPIVTSDAFKYYEPAMRRTFGEHFVYVQVKNRYAKQGVVCSTSKQVLGSPLAYEYAWARSEDSKVPNTAYIERVNLIKRTRCSMLHRRAAHPGRKPSKIEQALELVRLAHNFVHRHSSLRLGKEKRTPAMQVGIFNRPLTFREIFSWAVPAAQKRRHRLDQLFNGPNRNSLCVAASNNS